MPWTSPAIVAAVGQAYPGDDGRRHPVRPVSAAAWSRRHYGDVVSAPRPQILQLLICDIDMSAVDSARETLAVLRNRSEFTQSDKAESRG